MTAKKQVPTKRNANTLEIMHDKNKTEDHQFAEIGLSATTLNAVTARTFSQQTMGEIDLTETISVMREKVAQVNSGNLIELEATLTAQTVSLDTIFNELARRAALNMGEHMSATESYMRLALKAQAQCARTIEVLAAMKTPPVVFAKQANISNGHQQINNSIQSSTRTHAHTGKTVNQQNELLEHQKNGEWLDTGKTTTASGIDKELATVATLNRGTNTAR
ncbi:hypothetical protein [Sulfurirhabdus autotrophica]|uniref:Uncharacterized protein n=1 Tax=Sulfurirhabdus autotrophica TaxID=1706046 RepID=A0A4V2W2W3_9PROT|nr:hypothetical protein [Sulfurirhabdus autotrophica]TCV89669.1 hypothetical protein EDC63_102189 [Sulfurirhabdus autotrophica]